MKTLVVAVSGGVDSVVLLHILARRQEAKLTIAHFDHGIRLESDADARFVEGLAAMYQLPFFVKQEILGEQASEELARDRRYAFLNEVAEKVDGHIVTAHHADDVVETIAINISRGTGWRGLTPMSHQGIIRPLLGMTKQEIYKYALAHSLEWVEDETNQSERYLRNRMRRALHAIPHPVKKNILELRDDQERLRVDIEQELQMIIDQLGETGYSRYFFTTIQQGVAVEILRHLAHYAITHPQARRGLIAIKTSQPGTTTQLGNGYRLRFRKRDFIVETP